MTAPGGGEWRNFYGRRHGKTLRAGQKTLLETRLADLAPAGVSPDDNPDRAPVDLRALFPGKREIWLEVGFGGGEHMLAQAAANPDVGLIGCEPFINGVAMLLAAIEREGIANVRIHAGDARFLLDVLPDASIGRFFLLYPDPWPKMRHWRRRFIDDANLDALARVLRPGAGFRIATDIDAYVRHTRKHFARRDDFAPDPTHPDERTPWDDWPGTRYEAKALRDGRRPTYLSYLRT